MLDIEVRSKWSASILLTLTRLVIPTLDQQVMRHESNICLLLVCLFIYLFVVRLLFTCRNLLSNTQTQNQKRVATQLKINKQTTTTTTLTLRQ